MPTTGLRPRYRPLTCGGALSLVSSLARLDGTVGPLIMLSAMESPLPRPQSARHHVSVEITLEHVRNSVRSRAPNADNVIIVQAQMTAINNPYFTSTRRCVGRPERFDIFFTS